MINIPQCLDKSQPRFNGEGIQPGDYNGNHVRAINAALQRLGLSGLQLVEGEVPNESISLWWDTYQWGNDTLDVYVLGHNLHWKEILDYLNGMRTSLNGSKSLVEQNPPLKNYFIGNNTEKPHFVIFISVFDLVATDRNAITEISWLPMTILYDTLTENTDTPFEIAATEMPLSHVVFDSAQGKFVYGQAENIPGWKKSRAVFSDTDLQRVKDVCKRFNATLHSTIGEKLTYSQGLQWVKEALNIERDDWDASFVKAVEAVCNGPDKATVSNYLFSLSQKELGELLTSLGYDTTWIVDALYHR